MILVKLVVSFCAMNTVLSTRYPGFIGHNDWWNSRVNRLPNANRPVNLLHVLAGSLGNIMGDALSITGLGIPDGSHLHNIHELQMDNPHRYVHSAQLPPPVEEITGNHYHPVHSKQPNQFKFDDFVRNHVGDPFGPRFERPVQNHFGSGIMRPAVTQGRPMLHRPAVSRPRPIPGHHITMDPTPRPLPTKPTPIQDNNSTDEDEDADYDIDIRREPNQNV